MTMKIKINTLINEVTKRVVERLKNNMIYEGSGFDSIFEELKKSLDQVSILPDNVIDASMYKEHEIVDALKGIGFQYKKPISGKLHFFNKKTSVSLYLIQNSLRITLMP